MSKIEYAIIIKDKTRLELLIERFNTKAQAKFYIERSGGNFLDYVLEHDTFHFALEELQSQLGKLIKYKIIDRSFLPSFIFADNQLILVIGRDGLVANTAKYAGKTPIIAINPDPSRYDGILLPFKINNFTQAVNQVLLQSYSRRIVRFAAAQLGDGQKLLAFNDLFIGAASHISARYRISFQNKTEEHSSSGIIVSTKAGSTGWLSSVFNMAYGVTALFEKKQERKRPRIKEDQLLFAVREPFKSVRTQVELCTGLIDPKNQLEVESLMPSGGVIFSDGIEADFIQFNSGSKAKISLAAESALLVLNPSLVSDKKSKSKQIKGKNSTPKSKRYVTKKRPQ